MFGNKLFLGMMALQMVRFDADKGGGGGGGNEGDKGGGNQPTIADLQKQIADLQKKLDTSAGGKGGKNDSTNNNDNDDLRKKAEDERKQRESKQADTKAIESALQFNLGMENFLKENKDIFPKEIEDIISVAKKETYDTAADKANAIKAAVIQSFFHVEDNLNALTQSQKETVADFLKLSKTGRESKAASLYDTVFEPALKMMKDVKKAQELAKAKNGYASHGTVMEGYKQRLLESAKKAFINRRKGND